jgi:hypothetical protein
MKIQLQNFVFQKRGENYPKKKIKYIYIESSLGKYNSIHPEIKVIA